MNNTYSYVLSCRQLPVLRDHRVTGRHLLPGAAFLYYALLSTEFDFPYQMQDIYFYQPFIINSHEEKTLYVTTRQQPTGTQFLIYTLDPGGRKIRHARCLGKIGSGAGPGSESCQTVRRRCRSTMSAYRFYRLLVPTGLAYGITLRMVQALYYNEREALVELDWPAKISSPGNRLPFHPAVLDALFHAVGILYLDKPLYVPYYLQELLLYQPLAAPLCSHTVLKEAPDERSEWELKHDITALNRAGAVMCTMKGCIYRKVSS